jgi:hypothetical protein
MDATFFSLQRPGILLKVTYYSTNKTAKFILSAKFGRCWYYFTTLEKCQQEA